MRSNTLSKQRSEINNVLRMSDTQNYDKIECPKDFLLVTCIELMQQCQIK